MKITPPRKSRRIATIADVDRRMEKLARATAAGFVGHDARFTKVDIRLDKLEKTVATGFVGNDARFAKIETKLAEHDARFDKVEARLGKVEGDIENLAVMTANGFEDVRREIRNSEDRIVGAIRAVGISVPLP